MGPWCSLVSIAALGGPFFRKASTEKELRSTSLHSLPKERGSKKAADPGSNALAENAAALKIRAAPSYKSILFL